MFIHFKVHLAHEDAPTMVDHTLRWTRIGLKHKSHNAANQTIRQAPFKGHVRSGVSNSNVLEGCTLKEKG